MTVATAHQGTLGGILSVPWHSAGAVNIDGLLVNNALLTHPPRCTWKRCHALFLQAFNEMVAHTILVVLVLVDTGHYRVPQQKQRQTNHSHLPHFVSAHPHAG